MNASPFTSTASRTAHSALPVPAPIVRQLPPFQKWLGFSEWLVVVVIALIALGLHLRFVTHVGGLWRDEANSIQLSSLPSFAQVWQHLDFDSFPILFFAVLRAWTGIFGHSDTALRGLGLLIGLAVLIAMWINARAVGAHLPVLSFALIGLNPMIIALHDARAAGLLEDPFPRVRAQVQQRGDAGVSLEARRDGSRSASASTSSRRPTPG